MAELLANGADWKNLTTETKLESDGAAVIKFLGAPDHHHPELRLAHTDVIAVLKGLAPPPEETKAEKEAKERAEREAVEKAQHEREAREREAAEKAAREKAEREKKEKEEKEHHEGPGIVFTPGVNAGDEPLDIAAVHALGAKVVRTEIGASDIGSIAHDVVEGWSAQGVKICLLVSFDGSMITPAQCKELGPIAEKFANDLIAIEIGNETSYGYQYNDGYTDASYRERARTYATRVREAAEACKPHGVSVTCQASDGGSGSSVWVNEMFASQPELAKYAGSWLGHFYPADGIAELKRMIADLKPYAGTGTVPIDCTEFGWNNAAGVSREQAAKDLEAYVPEYRSVCEGRTRIMTLYQNRDQSQSAPADEREWGAVNHEAQPKEPYTTACKKFMAE